MTGLKSIPMRVALFFCIFFFSNVNAAKPAAPSSDYKPVIEAVISEVIIPGYKRLKIAASLQTAALAQLCEQANAAGLATAQKQFIPLVKAWSNVEIFHFGPAQSGNRFERLFFWPDRRSRGIRQVGRMLERKDPTVLTIDSLRKKSVAVQGITALEYILFGREAGTLAQGQENTFQCQYARTISGAMEQTTSDLLADWQQQNGFARLMLTAGAKNKIFKNDQEVIRDILQYSAQLVQAITDQKLKPALQEDLETARPKRVPFWRSNLLLTHIESNLASLLILQEKGKLSTLLPVEDSGHATTLTFEIRQVLETLQPYRVKQAAWRDILLSSKGYDDLRYILNPLKGAHLILSDYYPKALGITMGFNALDGD